MLRIRFKLMLALLISAFVFAFGAQELRATTLTYIVGTCKAGTQFTTIQSALNKSPAANVIEVCPGTYPEQLTIINAVTLEGIMSGNSSAIRITPPAAGLATNGTINNGEPAAIHVFVKNATGAVNLTNLIVDSTNNKVPVDVFLVGVLYQHSPGTVNHVIATHQQANGIGPQSNVLIRRVDHEAAVDGYARLAQARYITYSDRGLDVMADTDLRNDFEAAVTDHAVLGTPDEVIGKLIDLITTLPVDPLLMRPQWPTMSAGEAITTMNRLAREILPAIAAVTPLPTLLA